MSTEKTFLNGLFIKVRRATTPEFVILEAGVKVDEFKEFLDKHADNNFVNFRVLNSKSGKLYAELDTWKPKEQASGIPPIQPNTSGQGSLVQEDEDLPF